MFKPSVNFVGTKARVKFNGDCLKQDKISFDHGKIVNIYIIYEIERNVDISSYLTLFLWCSYTEHIDIDLYKYSGYDIGFNRKAFFPIGDEVGKNVIIFGVDMTSSPYVDNKKKRCFNSC